MRAHAAAFQLFRAQTVKGISYRQGCAFRSCTSAGSVPSPKKCFTHRFAHHTSRGAKKRKLISQLPLENRLIFKGFILLEVALQQTLEGAAVTGFVAGHLVHGVVDGVQVQLLGLLGQVHLAGAGTALGVNAHLSCEGGKLVSGRDLCPQMTLRLAKPDTVLPRMQAFYDDADTLIFGCAGLKGILPAELHSPGLGLFLFGEVCTVNDQAEFGNLMLSKLRITKR